MKTMDEIYDVVGRLQKRQKEINEKPGDRKYELLQYQINALIFAAEVDFSEGSWIDYFDK